MPIFSIIVPVYKAEKFIGECIESVISQDFSDFELILVDDGSPDRSGEICDDYAKSDSRIKVIHKENGGATAARLLAAESSCGEYIFPLDSDDTLLPSILSSVYGIIKAHSPDIITFQYDRAGGGSICVPYVANRFFEGEALQDIRNRLIYDPHLGSFNSGITTFSLCTKAIRRELYLRYQLSVPRDIIRGEDLAVSSVAIYNCKSIYFLDRVGYFYRDNGGSQMNTFRENDMKLLKKLYTYLFENLGAENENAIKCFVLITASEYAMSAAKHFESTKDYLRLIECEIDADIKSIMKSAKMGKLAPKEWARIFLAKHSMYRLLRFLVH